LRSRIIRGIKSRLRDFGKPNTRPSSTPTEIAERPNTTSGSFLTPTQKFYEDLLTNNLSIFNSFALQSRSLTLRDIYARAASEGRHDTSSLLSEIDEVLKQSCENATILDHVAYNREILLSLASYLLDTSRSDLDTQSGLQVLRIVLAKYGDIAFTEHHKLQFVEALAEIANYEEQTRLMKRFEIKTLAPLQSELMEIDRIARTEDSSAEWVKAINSLYSTLDMTNIVLENDVSKPLFDRLTSVPGKEVDGPTVSIIMPTYKPDSGIYTAVRSLVNQTWKNIEILVVDDGSPKEFDFIFSEVERLDTRIRVIRQAENGGAYVARNTGLLEARGEYITTHDDDDWSHPEKIELQVSSLVNDDTIVATTSAHIRTTSDMHFRRINAKPRHLQTNYSSLMFRKSAIDQTGGWDISIRGSDTELAGRLIQHFGSGSLIHFVDKPMSFSRVWAGSLTSGEIYRGYFAYSRLLYRWAFRQWHSDSKKAGRKPVLDPDRPRPFAVPTTFEPGNRNKDLGLFDVVYVTDYSRRSKFANRVLHEIETAVSAGLRVGYMHLNSPQTVKRSEITPRLFDLQLAGKITQVADTNGAETKLMVVYDASIGMFLDQFSSTVVVRRGIVVHDKGAVLKNSDGGEAFHPRIVLKHLDKSFNTYFSLVGAAREDQDGLKDQLPPARLLENRHIWSTHIATVPSTIKAPKQQPVVGFHSFGNKYRWPADRQKFETLYLSGDHKVLFYGMLKPLKRQLGEDIITEAQELDAFTFSLMEFFDRIDFWVYSPHERLVDRPWQAVIQALQAGKVVILPHHLEPLYGGAALYADADNVAALIAEYSQDIDKYVEQAKRGQELVAGRFSRAAYISRLESLMSLHFDYRK